MQQVKIFRSFVLLGLTVSTLAASIWALPSRGENQQGAQGVTPVPVRFSELKKGDQHLSQARMSMFIGNENENKELLEVLGSPQPSMAALAAKGLLQEILSGLANHEAPSQTHGKIRPFDFKKGYLSEGVNLKNNFFAGVFSVENDSDEAVDLYIDNEFSYSSRVTLFSASGIGNAGPWSLHGQAGHQMIAGDDVLNSNTMVFRLHLEPMEKRTFVLFFEGHLLQASFWLRDSQGFWQHAAFDDAVLSAMLGVLLFVVIYNIFLWISYHSSIYLLYSAYVTTNFLWISMMSGFGIKVLRNMGLQGWDFTLVPVYSTLLMLIMALVFSGIFNRISSFSRNAVRVEWTLLAAFFVYGITVQFHPRPSIEIFNNTINIAVILMLYGGYKSMRLGNQFSRIFLIGWVLYLCFGMYGSLCFLGIVNPSPLTKWGTFAGIIAEVTILSMAVGKRIKAKEERLQKEKAKAFAEMQIAADRVMQIVEANDPDAKTRAQNAAGSNSSPTISLKAAGESDDFEGISKVLDASVSLVERQQKTIHDLLDNVQAAIILCNKEGRIIEGGYSSFAKTMFGGKLGGRRLASLFFSSEQNRVSESFDALLEQVFELGFLAEELVKDIPSEYHINERYLRAEIKPIMDEKGDTVAAALFTIRDETNLKRAQELNVRGIEALNILRTPQKLRMFLDSFKRQQEELNSLLQRFDGRLSRGPALSKSRMILHTIKGNAASLKAPHLLPIDKLCHQLEELQELTTKDVEQLENLLKKCFNRNPEVFSAFDVDDKARLVHMRRSLVDAILEEFSMQIQDASKLRLDGNKVKKSGELASTERVQSLKDDIMASIDGFCVKDLLEGFCIDADRIAGSLKKSVSVKVDFDAKLSDGQLRFMKPLFSVVSHAIRNAIDHGIEPSQERAALKKDPVGLIELQVQALDSQICVKIRDDGRGLDRVRIMDKARKSLGIRNDDPRMSPERWPYLIFEEELSTKEAVTDISGRGIGMSAILNEVERLQGGIELKSTEGQGTTILIRVPLPGLGRDKGHTLAV